MWEGVLACTTCVLDYWDFLPRRVYTGRIWVELYPGQWAPYIDLTLPAGDIIDLTGEDEYECAVCLDTHEEVTSFPCGHYLCPGCMLRYIHANGDAPNCHYCRAPFRVWEAEDGTIRFLPREEDEDDVETIPPEEDNEWDLDYIPSTP